MEKVIMRALDTERVDHIDGNTLDNRKCNLRLATPTENARNSRKAKGKWTSRYKGVSWSRVDRRWRAEIRVNGKIVYLGLHRVEYLAACAYDRAAIKHFSRFARPNFPQLMLEEVAP